MRENTITWVLTELKRDYTGSLNLDFTDENMRELVSQSFHILGLGDKITKEEWNDPSKSKPDDAAYIQNFIKTTGLLKAYSRLPMYRNDINHGGFTIEKNSNGDILKMPIESHKFKQVLEKSYRELMEKITTYESTRQNAAE